MARFGGPFFRPKIGTFDNPEDAHQAYLVEKSKLHKFQKTPRIN